jgi:Ser/Thr protein kinase RdoA (MazF antagonist)
MVVFSYAEGKKVRFLTNEMCATIGTFMAKMHKCTSKQNIERVNYTQDIILRNPYEFATRYFSESLDEMKYLKRLINELNTSFLNGNAASWQKGIIHMDIWYDNFNVDSKGEITVFDFDFCGTGWFVLDVAYFCSQLFHIETDKKQYDEKRTIFLEAYQRVLPLSKQEIQGIPSAGAAAWIFYLGVQSQRFDWSNIFLSENYLKMFVSRIKSWLDYTK